MSLLKASRARLRACPPSHGDLKSSRTLRDTERRGRQESHPEGLRPGLGSTERGRVTRGVLFVGLPELRARAGNCWEPLPPAPSTMSQSRAGSRGPRTQLSGPERVPA